MQTSEKSPPTLEAHERPWPNDMEATPLLPATRPPMTKATKRGYTYLLFTLCASLYFLPFMRIILPGDGDEGILVYGAVRIAHGQVPSIG
jgi:hypothetical protein